MDNPHYVWADVSSDDSNLWMIYYTHYRKLSTPDYVRTVVHSECTVKDEKKEKIIPYTLQEQKNRESEHKI
jgi:hypothetical protein